MDENNLVVKHNKLIEAQGRLTVMEQKFFLGVVSLITPQDEDFKEYRITIDEVIESFGVDRSNAYRVAMETAEKIMEVPIRIREGKRHLATRLFSSAEYIEGKGYVAMCFDPKLKPYLLQLNEQFTRYELKNILKMTSTYSIKIYELLKQYQKIGKRAFEIEELRAFLDIEEHEYQRFYNFEKRVLEVATNEINDKTDLKVSYTKKRRGRRIGIIEFDIKSPIGDAKTENEKALADLYDFDALKAKMGLSDARFSNEQVMELYELACEHADEVVSPHEYVRLNYNHAISKNPKSLFAYLKKALKDDYALANLHVKLEYYEGE